MGPGLFCGIFSYLWPADGLDRDFENEAGIATKKSSAKWIPRKSRVSCKKGPPHHAYVWQIGPFW